VGPVVAGCLLIVVLGKLLASIVYPSGNGTSAFTVQLNITCITVNWVSGKGRG
jgi:hypothetical protein